MSSVVSGSPKCIALDHKIVSGLEDYRPFHPDLDLCVESASEVDNIETDSIRSDTDEDDHFIVEKIVAKRYNSHKCQYEYKIKWLGYDSKENTWELPSNIPDRMLNDYERSVISTATKTSEPRRSGLRPRSTLKSKVKEDFIVNM